MTSNFSISLSPFLKLLDTKWTQSLTIIFVTRPGKDGDWTQHALDTVVAAAGVAATNARVANPEIRETPHIR